MNSLNEIDRLERKLSDMRIRYKVASPSMQAYLKVGASLIKAKLEKLKSEEEKSEKLF